MQGKRGITGDDKILSNQTEVDGEASNDRIPTKRGVLKLLPKNNGVVMESTDCKVDEDTRMIGFQ